MASNLYDWSVVAANNSNSDGDLTWAEGQAPSTVNNSARVMMQRVKQLLVDIGGSIAAAGTANGLTVTASSPFAAYADGMILSFRASASNTGAATLSVNGIGAKAIRKMAITGDIALSANDIRNTGLYVVQYSAALNGAAGAWLLVNPTLAAMVPTFQVFTAGGTWTNPGCRRAVFEAVGGGGGSGGSDGQGAGKATATGGGGSGFYGLTGFLDVSAVVSAVVTIGAAGAAGAAAAGNGGNGGNTAITIAATTYTWGGGNASTGNLASATVGGSDAGGAGGVGTNLIGASQPGGPAIYTSDSYATGVNSNGTAGNGGSNPLGTGGQGAHWFSPTTGVAAVAGTGFGAGGSGSGVSQSTGNIAGAAGTAGYMRVWEYY